MPSAVVPEVIPVAEPIPSHFEVAAQVLERAVQAGCQDANVLYMLAMAHKRQGKINEARERLAQGPAARRQRHPANGTALAARESARPGGGRIRSRRTDGPGSYEICHNLLLTRLTLGKVEDCLFLLPTALELASRRGADTREDERRFCWCCRRFCRRVRRATATARTPRCLAELSSADEQRLLKVVRSLGQLDTVHTLLKTLTESRPRSAAVREAYLEAVLVKAKELVDRCVWTEAELLLRPLSREKGGSRASQIALLNLLGCCACMTQDFDSAIKHFSSAIKLAPNDARLHQNLALTYEIKGELAQADPYWNRYFDLLDDRVPAPPDIPRYIEHLAYESLGRLATRYSEKEKWSSALSYVQRRQHLRPNDPDTLERLFHLYNQSKRPQDARRTLEGLRRLRPGEPQYELYELDLIEVKGLNDIEKLLTEIERILKRYPNDIRVEERAIGMVGNVIPLMGNLCDQLTDQMSKVIDQVRNLPNYQINWSAVREVMRDLLREFQKLRRITGKCLPLVTNDEHRRIVRDLAEHIDKKMEACRSMGA